MEEAFASDIPRYGFRLRLSSREGKNCLISPWYEGSIGCLVPDDDYPTNATCGDTIAIDWHIAVDLMTNGFEIPLNQKLDNTAYLHSSVKKHRTCHAGKNKYGYRGAISLEECLESFAKEEQIPEVSNVTNSSLTFSSSVLLAQIYCSYHRRIVQSARISESKLKR